MPYKQFEDLPVWRKAIELTVQVHDLSSSGALKGFGGLRDQLERAALSVSNNIAEGFERVTRDELISFLYIARGSAGEVRSMAHVCLRLFDAEQDRIKASAVHDLIVEISRQIGGWIESLKNSDALSPRQRNEATRHAASEAKRREAFLIEHQRIAKQGLPSDTSMASPPNEPPSGSVP
jgi:four helix bundle protein